MSKMPVSAGSLDQLEGHTKVHLLHNFTVIVEDIGAS